MDNPAFYKTVNGLQRRDARIFSDEFGDKFERMSGRCIDIGSGPGDVVMDFILPKLPPNATVVCSDISESMVNFGKEEYKNDNRVSYIHLDIESPLPERLMGQFDNVTSFYCLHWCHNIRRAFENIFELVRPGGKTLATFIANYPAYDSYKYLAEHSRYQPYMEDVDRHIPVFQDVANKPDAMRTLLKEVGFEVRHCSVRENNYTFKSCDMYSKLMLALNPFIKRMPTGLREEYKKDLTEEGMRCASPRRGKSDNEGEYGASCTYSSFMMYLRKPLTK